MKKFFIEHLQGLSPGYLNQDSWDGSHSRIYPTNNGEFVIKLCLNYSCRAPINLYHPEIFHVRFYTVGQDLKLITSTTQDVPNFTANLDYDLAINENKYYLCQGSIVGQQSYSFPDLIPQEINKRNLKFPRSGRVFFRSETKGILCFSYDGLSGCACDMFLKNVKFDKNDVILFDYHSDTSYTCKVMTLSEEEHRVAAVAISNDELTACALVGHESKPWEVVILDLQ